MKHALLCLLAVLGCDATDPTTEVEQSVTSAHLTYYGGKVISNVKVEIVYWGTGVFDAGQLPGFYTTITNSPYLDWLSEYNTPTQMIGRGSYLGAYTDTTAPTSNTITDAAIQAEISKLVTAGSIPAPDDNTVYMVYFPPGKTITQGGSSSCEAFCAYHGTFKRNSSNVYYGVIPDLGGAGCASGCGTNGQFGNTCSWSSHELAEAITDSEVGLATGSSLGPPLAWYDSTNGEIGDICAEGTDGMIGGYTVQSLWSNAANACIVTRPTNFSLALSPPTNTIFTGGTATYTVASTVITGSTTITFSVGALPTGITAAFNPPTVTTGGTSTLTLTAAANAPAAAATAFTVTGANGVVSASATASLTVVIPDFSLTPAATTLSVNGGESTMVAIDTSVLAGAPGPIALAATGLPGGVTATFTPATVIAGTTSMLTLTATADASAVTAAPFTISGVSGTITHTATATVDIVAADYILSVDPTAVSIHVGATGQATVHSTVSVGAPSAITLTAALLPAGVTATFSPPTLAPGDSSTIELAVASDASLGTTNLLVVGATHSAALSLTIVGDPIPPDAGMDGSGSGSNDGSGDAETGDHHGGCDAGGGASGFVVVLLIAIAASRRLRA